MPVRKRKVPGGWEVVKAKRTTKAKADAQEKGGNLKPGGNAMGNIKVILGVCLVLILGILTPALPQELPFSVSRIEVFDHPGDFGDYLHGDYPDTSSSLVRVETFGHAKGTFPAGYTDEDRVWGIGDYALLCSGFAVEGYVVTAAHCVEPQKVTIKDGDNVYYVTGVVEVLDRMITIKSSFDDMEDGSMPGVVKYVNTDKDLALLSYPLEGRRWIKDMPFEVVYTDGLWTGSNVAVLARKREHPYDDPGWATEARYGHVLETCAKVPEAMTRELPWFSTNHVTTDLQIWGGDSGSPVFAFINSRPVIVGVASAGLLMDPGWTYFARIDAIKNILVAEQNQ